MRGCFADWMRFRPIRLAAPHGINREQQVMQQNQKLGTQPNHQILEQDPVPFPDRKISGASLELFRVFMPGKEKRPGEPGRLGVFDRVGSYEPFGLISA
jgi:hypothetical protein